jgi:hypothetical protein
MVNKDLIRHILKEETRDTKSKLIKQIEDEGLYSIAELVGGLDNLKKILKDNPEMVERIENQKGLVKVSWTTDGDDPSIDLPFKIIGAGWNIWMTNSWPIVNIIYNENKLTKDENYKFKDFLYDSFNDESSVRVLKLNSDEPRMHKTYVQLGEINGKTAQKNTTDLSRSYDLSDIREIVETLGYDNIIKEEVDNTKEIQKNLRTIKILLSQISWEGLCDIWVEYNPVDKDYEIRSKSIKRHFDHDEIVNELNFVEESIKAMGLRPYVFSPWHVDNCEDEVEFMNESIDKSDEKRNKIIEKIMDNIIFPEYKHIICGYDVKNDEVFNEPVVNVTFIGGYGTKLWPTTQGIQKMYSDVLDEIWNTIYDYINIPVGVTMETTPKCDEQENIYLRESIGKSENNKLKLVKDIIYTMFDNIIDLEYIAKRNEIMVYYDTQEELESSEICDTINDYTNLNVVPWYDYKKRTELKKDPDFYIDTERYEEELNENYSPAGKEIIPNEIVIHKSNPKFRDKIIEQGLKVRAGECYKIYAGYGTKCKPAIFATNSTNKRSWFDSTYDDDVWEIDTTMMPEIKWYKDRHYESSKKHIVTFQDIPKEAIKLIYEGSGKDGGIMESVDKSEDKKLKLVTKMIHEFFDDVSFIDIKKYENKPMIRVYFDNDEYAGNEETYFAEQIQDKIYEYTGIKLIPYWHNIQYNTDADFRLDAIKLKYDNEGNVINESEEKQPKYVNIIKNLIEPFKEEEDCVCEIRVTSEDDFYIIYLVFGTEELNDKFSSFLQRAEYTINLRNDVKNTIKDYLPIDNIYVGSISKPNCEWKPMNESTFFLRRVDTSLMEKEFFENLNIITDVYLDKYNNGVGFNFETFEDHAINYFIDNYYNDLTNYGENDYPYDEIYKFLSNHFHNKIKDKYDTFFGRNINESENKKQSLLKTIEKEGLYNFIEMSGLDISQISSVLKNMDNPKEVLKQYIRDFVLKHGNKWGDNSGTLSGYEIQLSDNKYVDDITVQDSDQIAVEILEFDQDEYGHTEQNDQYITTINNLTNDELLTIISWMMETIKNGDWNR